MKDFKKVDLQEPLKDTYITLWMHHFWFAADANQTTVSKLKTFFADALLEVGGDCELHLLLYLAHSLQHLLSLHDDDDATFVLC